MPEVQAPRSLGAVPSETQEGVIVFPFGLVFDRAILDPSTLNFDIQIDTAPTFSSVNAIKLTRTSSDARLRAFQNGQIGRAFEVQLPGRSANAVAWYWHVRINSGTFLSDWTPTRTFTVPAVQSLNQTQEIFDRLADENAYSKEANSSNVYKKLLQFGREMDLLLLEKDRTETDLVLDTARDTALTNNFAELISLERVASEEAAHHRWKTTNIWDAFVNLPGTEQGMQNVVKAFVAECPVVLDLTATEGWIVDQNLIKVPTRPDLEPIIVVFAQPQKGNSWVLNVFNSWDLTFDQNVLTTFVNRMKPAHSQVTISFKDNRNWSLRYNREADWDLWTNSGTIDTTTNPGTIRLTGGSTTGMLTSPVTQVTGQNGYDAPEIAFEESGGTILVEARTSEDGSSFGSWVTLERGVEPSALDIQDFIQFRITISRTGAADPNPILSLLEFKGTRA
jgi:hypothetical protein